MRVISVKAFREFWEKKGHEDSEPALRAWYAEAKDAEWKRPSEIKEKYLSASILRNNRIVFNIKGNKYRLVVAIRYEFKIIYIRFIGTHKEYDEINAETI